MIAIRSAAFLFLLALAGCMPFGDSWFKFGGTVTDPAGHPIQGAQLSISVDGKALDQGGTTITDVQGHYSFFESSCPCDFAFQLDVTAPGFKSYALSLPGKQANHLTKQDITLQPQ